LLCCLSFLRNKDNKIPAVLAQARLLTATLAVFELSPSKPPIPAASQLKEKHMSKPTHTAYVVKNPKEGSELPAQWREVGAIWPHKNGKGFDLVIFDQLAVSGRIRRRRLPALAVRKLADQIARGAGPTGQDKIARGVRLTTSRFRLTKRYGTLSCTEWWDPAKTRSLTFPEFRQLLEYFLSIYRAPLYAGQKLRCYSLFLPWVEVHFSYMLGNLIIAVDQLLI
jgi:hypothetical protein